MANEPVNLPHLFKQIMHLDQIYQIINHLSQEFGQSTLTNFTGNQITISVQNKETSKSIGYLFGFIEKMKANQEVFMFNEYQASETTLEEIFNTFAKEHGISKLNRSIKRSINVKKKT